MLRSRFRWLAVAVVVVALGLDAGIRAVQLRADSREYRKKAALFAESAATFRVLAESTIEDAASARANAKLLRNHQNMQNPPPVLSSWIQGLEEHSGRLSDETKVEIAESVAQMYESMAKEDLRRAENSADQSRKYARAAIFPWKGAPADSSEP